MAQQYTIQKPIEVTGIGLHSGQAVTLMLKPAPANTGIVFRRMDLPNQPMVKANAKAVCDTRMCTVLQGDGASVATVEHMLSALHAMGIDNLYLEIDASELPILDGSSILFVTYLEQAGRLAQSEKRHYLEVIKPVRVTEGDKWAELTPYEGFKIIFDIEYTHPVILQTNMHYEFELGDVDIYKNEIAKARTYGFLKEYEWLKAKGLVRGGSLENALVLDDTKVLNPEGLRIPDEFVKHKILDVMGDLYLLEHPLRACYHGFKSGHTLNNQLALALLNDVSAFRMVSV